MSTPMAMLEKSQTYALNSQVKSFQVPTVDSLGKIHYYDITVTLTVNTDGTVSPTANVVAALSPAITTKVLVPGNYKSVDGLTICKVTNMTLTNGRIQSFLTCTYSTNTISTLSVATGYVTAGHPYLTELVSAGVNVRSDVNTQTWGMLTNGLFRAGGCSYYPGYPVSAKTDGSTLVLSVFSSSSPSAFFCSDTFSKF